MNNTLAKIDDRKMAVREYKNKSGEITRTASSDSRLQFGEFGKLFGFEHGGAEHRAEFSRYCSSRHAEALAHLEKARQSGLSLNKSVETVDASGNVVGLRLAFSTAKTPKVKAPKVKQEDILSTLTSLPKAELEALLAKLNS